MAEETSLRDACVELVFYACYRLRLDIEVTAMAISILLRFIRHEGDEFSSAKLGEDEIKLVVATCLFLAAKTEECQRRLRDVINVTHRLTWSKPPSRVLVGTPSPAPSEADEDDRGGTLVLDHDYLALKERVVHMEQRVLRALAFDLEASQPFRLLLHFAKFLRVDRCALRRAWALVVDGLWSPQCLDTPPNALAAAALYLAEQFGSSQLPAGQASPSSRQSLPWWKVLGVSDEDMASVCERLLRAAKEASLVSSKRGLDKESPSVESTKKRKSL